MDEQAHAVLLGVHRGLDQRDAHLTVCCSHKKTPKPLITVCVKREGEGGKAWLCVREKEVAIK